MYNALLDKLDGKQLIIQFWDEGYSAFDHDGGEGIKISTQHVNSNHLFHEMWHAYQAYQETVNSYESLLLNIELETWYAQYLYLSSLEEYKGGDLEKKYEGNSIYGYIKKIEGYIGNKGTLLSGKTESKLNNYILNQVIPIFYSIKDYVDYPYEIENRTVLDNFKNLRKLTEDC